MVSDGRDSEPGRDHTAAGQETEELPYIRIDTVERELVPRAIVVVREVEAIPAALFRIERLAIVHFDERVGADEIGVRVHTGNVGRREHVSDIGISIVLPFTEPRVQVLEAATDEQVLDRPDAGAATEVVRPNRVVGPVVPVGIGTETKEVLLGIVAVTPPRLQVQVVVCKPWKGDARLGCPVALDAPGRPDLERPPVGKQIAIAKADAVGEPAAGGQRTELRMEALTVEDEDGPVLDEVQRPLQAVRLVGCDLFGLLFATLAIGLLARLRFLRRRPLREDREHRYHP